MEKQQLSVSKFAHGIVTDRSLMQPSTNSTGRSAESIKELMVLKDKQIGIGMSYKYSNLILSATLLRLMAPSTDSWSRVTGSSRKVPRYLLIRYLPALFLNASEKLVYQADQAMMISQELDILMSKINLFQILTMSYQLWCNKDIFINFCKAKSQYFLCFMLYFT